MQFLSFHRHHRGKVLMFADVVAQVEEFDAAFFEVLDTIVPSRF